MTRVIPLAEFIDRREVGGHRSGVDRLIAPESVLPVSDVAVEHAHADGPTAALALAVEGEEPVHGEEIEDGSGSDSGFGEVRGEIFTQSDIDEAVLRGRAQMQTELDAMLTQHKGDVECAVAAAANHIEIGVASASAELLSATCSELVSEAAIQRLVGDVQACVAQTADAVPVICGPEGLVLEVEQFLEKAGIKCCVAGVASSGREASAEGEHTDDGTVSVVVGDTLIEALVAQWRQDLQDCLG